MGLQVPVLGKSASLHHCAILERPKNGVILGRSREKTHGKGRNVVRSNEVLPRRITLLVR
jgi:hypothetical protein